MADLVEGVDAPALASGRHPLGQPTRPSQKMWVIVRATARDRPYYTRASQADSSYSRGDPLRSPLRRGSGDQNGGDAQHKASPLGIDVSKWTLDVRLEHPCPAESSKSPPSYFDAYRTVCHA